MVRQNIDGVHMDSLEPFRSLLSGKRHHCANTGGQRRCQQLHIVLLSTNMALNAVISAAQQQQQIVRFHVLLIPSVEVGQRGKTKPPPAAQCSGDPYFSMARLEVRIFAVEVFEGWEQQLSSLLTLATVERRIDACGDLTINLHIGTVLVQGRTRHLNGYWNTVPVVVQMVNQCFKRFFFSNRFTEIYAFIGCSFAIQYEQ
jgi:hypothetical protein